MKFSFCSSAGLLAVAALIGGCASATPRSQGWVTLLDGSKPQTLANWNQLVEPNWRVEDGVVIADQRTGKESTFLITKQSYKDFVIRAEVWVTPDTNSGIFMRASDPTHVTAKNSYEMNIWDNYKVTWYGTGAIANFGKVDPMPKAGNKWSTFEITARGTHISVLMDGAKTVEIDDGTYAEGPIALQYGGGIVKWRKVEIKRL
jgi:hypothetical protein